jgi:hypothetical protein
VHMDAAVLSVSISNITIHSGDHQTKCEQKGTNPGTHYHCTDTSTLNIASTVHADVLGGDLE